MSGPGPLLDRRPGPRLRWTQHAACAGHETRLWFIEDRDGSYREARFICRSCPVRTECLEWALETNTDHGVFGGLTPRERKPLASRRRREKR